MIETANALGSKPSHVSNVGDASLRRQAGDIRSVNENNRGKGLQLVLTGRIESGQMVDYHELTCAYEFVVGPDWKVHTGSENGETQNARNRPESDERPSVVWNFPIDASFESSNVSGWPRLSISVRDEARNLVGYGSVYVPTKCGTCERYVRLFMPLGSTSLGHKIAILTSELPEFYDSRFTTACKGREAVRVVSAGVIKVVLTSRITNTEALGYS